MGIFSFLTFFPLYYMPVRRNLEIEAYKGGRTMKESWNPEIAEMQVINRDILLKLWQSNIISKSFYAFCNEEECKIIEMMNKINAIDDALSYIGVFMIVLAVFERYYFG